MTDSASFPTSRLVVRDLHVGYGSHEVVRGVSLAVGAGEVVGLIGHNGAGKTTTLKGIAGLLRQGAGELELEGSRIDGLRSAERVKRGLVYLPQEGAVFPGLTVRANLLLGASVERDRRELRARQGAVYDLFPILRERLHQPAGSLSGGQQRMLSIGIAMMAGARILLLDEPSLGLAPVVYEEVLAAVLDMVTTKNLSVLIVEQVIGRLGSICERLSIMRSGEIVRQISGDEARSTEDWASLL